jgi:hypothetical protein
VCRPCGSARTRPYFRWLGAVIWVSVPLLNRAALRPQATEAQHIIGLARETGLEPAASAVTGRRSNQLSYSRNPIRRGPRRLTVTRCH